MTTDVKLDIHRREPFAEGIEFGETGTYERLVGCVHFELDPDDPANDVVTDLEYAPRNEDGKVAYETDLYVLKPVVLSKGNRRLLYDVNNRGDKRILQFMNDAVHSNDPSMEEHAGNGFLLRRGYSIVWSGWQGNLVSGNDRMTIEVPVAEDDGDVVTGTVRAEFCVDERGIECLPLSGNHYTTSYEVFGPEAETATLTKRERQQDSRERVPADEWSFARLGDGIPTPSPSHCHYPNEFEPGLLYELVYTAKDPLVMGLGFTGVRDLVSFLRNEETDAAGTVNPLRDGNVAMEQVYGWGRSQSGRFLREFTYRGFNVDTRGRRVFDAIAPHVSGAGRVALNYRFAQPGRAPFQHRNHLYPSDQFPFAYDTVEDPLTGRVDGIRKRPDTDPLIIHTQTSSEYWCRRGSLVHTTPDGKDLGDQEGVRVYLFASSQHFADPLEGPQTGPHRYPSNPLNTTPLLRAVMDALDAWATDGESPPESQIPSREAGSLVPPAVVGEEFPDVPGVALPEEPNRLHVQDFGPDFDRGVVAKQPPEVDLEREYAILVPMVGIDGNDDGGIRTPHIEVPLGTHTGWNLRNHGDGGRVLSDLTGSYFPFPETTRDRTERGDPRRSVAERYANRAQYVREIREAASNLVDEGVLLEEDGDRYVEGALEMDRTSF